VTHPLEITVLLLESESFLTTQ